MLRAQVVNVEKSGVQTLTDGRIRTIPRSLLTNSSSMTSPPFPLASRKETNKDGSVVVLIKVQHEGPQKCRREAGDGPRTC
jgi:hypothetical protein